MQEKLIKIDKSDKKNTYNEIQWEQIAIVVRARMKIQIV